MVANELPQLLPRSLIYLQQIDLRKMFVSPKIILIWPVTCSKHSDSENQRYPRRGKVNLGDNK